MKKKRIIFLFLAAALLFSLLSVGAGAEEAEAEEAPLANIYFLNVSTNALVGDCILIESDGHWGLIDAGHRQQSTITDSDGTVYRCTAQQGLSSQQNGKFGESVAVWIASALGVSHLDFVLATHSHSDHIGGMPAIAQYGYYSKDLEYHMLVDESTVYFYKPYFHINEYEDDLPGAEEDAEEDEADEADGEEAEHITRIVTQERGTKAISSWHNQAFYYQAVSAMQEKGCVMADVSGGAEPGGTGSAERCEALAELINRDSALSDCVYSEGDPEDLYDDWFSFRMGKAEIRLYNLLPRVTEKNENVNSIIAALDDGTNTAVFLADLNVEQQTEQKIAEAIRDDMGTVDLLKAAHHGALYYSNSKGMLDALQPRICAVTATPVQRTDPVLGGLTCTRYYASARYGTEFYDVGAAGKGFLAQLGSDGITLYAFPDRGYAVDLKDPSPCLYAGSPPNGWAFWYSDYPESYKPAAGEWMYFLNGQPLTGWVEEKGKRYFFSEYGLLLDGAQEIDGKTYYLWTDDYYGLSYGSKLTGWLEQADGRYYFDENGVMLTGWQEIDGLRYYFGEDGAACVGWACIDGVWYRFGRDGALLTGWLADDGPGEQRRFYLNEDGAMHTGWLDADGARYCFGEDGAMLTGLQEIDGAWYCFGEDGVMLTGPQRIDGKRYCFGEDGVMLTGWQEIDGVRLRFGEDGAMLTGWQAFDGAWHYFDEDGLMLTGWHRVERDGKERLYCFGKDGAARFSFG